MGWWCGLGSCDVFLPKRMDEWERAVHPSCTGIWEAVISLWKRSKYYSETKTQWVWCWAFSRAHLPALHHHWDFVPLPWPEKQGRSSCELPGVSPAIGFPYVLSPLCPLMVFMAKYPISGRKPVLLCVTVFPAGLSVFHSTVSFCVIVIRAILE